MTIRRFLSDQVGGLIPLAGADRTVYPVDGAKYRVWLTWLRRTIAVDYHTSRLPRDVRRARAIERARLEQYAREQRLDAAERKTAERLAGDHRFQVGDIIPKWTGAIPAYVLEVRTRDGVWNRPVGEQRYAGEDGAEPDRSVEYPWVSLYRPADGGADQVEGWSTDEGLFDYEPVTVTAVAVQLGSPT